MADDTPGLLERVLALKAIPELASLHPDDLLALARVARPSQWEPGVDPTQQADDAPRVCFLLEGRVRSDPRGRISFHEAPCTLGLVEALADLRPAPWRADSVARALVVGRAQLLEVAEDEFELWRALLRTVCSEALRRGVARWAPPRGPIPPGGGDGLVELADRIVLLRAAAPLREAGVHLLGQIAAEMEMIERNPGELLWDAGHAARGALLIVEGAVSSRAAGRAPIRLGPGALLGLPESLSGGSHPERAVALGRLRALRIDTEALVDVLEDDPTTAEELLCAIAREVVRARRTRS